MERLRDAVAIGDLSLGCERCARWVSAGQADAAFARVYDRFDHGSAPEWPRQLELALSNACNLQCVMCNGDLSSSIRIHREHRSPLPVVYGEEFFSELDLFLPHLESVVFLGGEPFLGRESLRVMQRLIELGLQPSCSVTTNGTVWNDRVLEIVERLPMHVTISIDGHTREVFEGIRVGADHDVVLTNLEKFRSATRTSGGGVSLAFCLMAANYHELAPFLVWANGEDLSVFVNEVTYPPHLGLLHSSELDLTEVLALMDQQDADLASRMGTNRSVWERELANVRQLTSPSLAVSEVHVRTKPKASPHADEVTVCRATMEADSSQLVTSVDEDGDLLGLELASLIGHSLWDIQQRLAGHLGGLASTVMSRLEDGSEVLEIHFEDGDRSARLDARMRSNADGTQRWELQLTHASARGSVPG